jgi:hypothetical protein
MTKSRGLGLTRAEQHPGARLTRDKVAELRRRARAGETVKDLAAWAGVGWSTAYQAIVGRTWRTVDEPPVPVAHRRWTSAELEVLAAHADEPAPELAPALGRTPNAIRLRRSRRRI